VNNLHGHRHAHRCRTCTDKKQIGIAHQKTRRIIYDCDEESLSRSRQTPNESSKRLQICKAYSFPVLRTELPNDQCHLVETGLASQVGISRPVSTEQRQQPRRQFLHSISVKIHGWDVRTKTIAQSPQFDPSRVMFCQKFLLSLWILNDNDLLVQGTSRKNELLLSHEQREILPTRRTENWSSKRASGEQWNEKTDR